MAMVATTVWEVRTTGNAANGGGFNSARDPVNGIDYSQQDTAQLSPTDLYRVAANSLYSDSFTFTAAMVGNIIKIASGTHFNAGYYEIVAYVDATHVTLDSDPATEDTSAHKDGVGKVGGALVNFGVIIGMVAGMKWYIKDGDYTVTAAQFGSKNGTSTAPYVVEGYKTTRGDNPRGTDRPQLNSGTTEHIYGTYWKFLNLNFYGSGYAGTPHEICIGTNAYLRNCKFYSHQWSGTGYHSVSLSYYSIAIDCEFQRRSQNVSTEYACSATSTHFIGCYFHDSPNGVTGGGNTLIYCIFDTMVYNGATINTYTNLFVNCVFYSCAKAIYSGHINYDVRTLNCIVLTCTNGFECVGASVNFTSNYNNYYNNTNDVVNVTKGVDDTAVDPAFTDAANGDFSLAVGSGCRDTAFSIIQAIG
jgi:hypothetical protein